jgi:hypothetical protein
MEEDPNCTAHQSEPKNAGFTESSKKITSKGPSQYQIRPTNKIKKFIFIKVEL